MIDRFPRLLVPALAAALLALPACGPGGGKQAADPAARGRRVYLSNCTACHNPDPSRPGSVGPPIRGSSRALIEARVVRAAYPPGYTPKRKSRLMPAQPHLARSVDDLAAFLNQ
jgi:mono/diheme cytochrome c family protein